MCLIFLAWKAHPEYPLVVAANRDEFFARPTAPASFWDEAKNVVAGRDGEAAGTWMGLSKGGRFAALTNFRDPAQTQAGRPSRGKLVSDFLTGQASPPVYLEQVATLGRKCNGYNLLVGDIDSLWWSSNVSGEQRELAPGIYGISNHLLDTPWPKVGAGKTAISMALIELPDETGLGTLLHDDRVHPDHQLPRTGVPLEWERLLSAAFVKSPDYGTRSSTVMTIRGDGWATFDEQTWLPGARRGQRKRFRFCLETTPRISPP